MQSSNPFLNDKYFRGAGAGGAVIDATGTERGWGQVPPSYEAYESTPRSATMTMGGVASATGVMLVFVMVGAWFGWGRVTTEFLGIEQGTGKRVYSADLPMGWLIGSMVIGLVLALICSFKPPMARILGIPYAIAEGVFLGIISHAYDSQSQGIAIQAIVATAGVFLAMLALYGFRILRVTPRMTKGIIAATFGVLALYAVMFISRLFTDAGTDFMQSTSLLSIGVSLLIVGIAAFNLLLDFDFIERGVKEGLPKEMEWFGAFGLIVTLVWLYLELLRLLSKLQRR